MDYPNFLHILFLLLFCNVASASRASYGENCSKELRCESRNFMTCSPTENTCVCLMPDTMTFEESSGNCVALAGERCQYTALEGERTWSDEIPCISNAACANGMCECTPNYFEVANGTCLQKGDLGQNCSSNLMCSSEKYLACGPEQNCICDNSHILERGYCRLKAGVTCNRYDGNNPCVQMSYCSSTSYGYRCTCQTGYFASLTGYCDPKRIFGMSCTEDVQCDEGNLYRCNSATKMCDCAQGFGFHPGQGSCKVSPNAGECYSDNDCVPNAKCPRQRDTKCHCKVGFIPFSGYCLVAENDPCDADVIDDSVSGNARITSKTCVPGLVCRDSRCYCLYKDHQVFNESGTDHKCVSLLGGPCNSTGDCARNSECLPSKAGLMECQCKEGFTQAGRHCDIAYGQKCSQGDVESRCDRYGPLECSVREICECSEFQIYDNVTLKCRGLVGARCEQNDNSQSVVFRTGKKGQQFCTDGAICKPFRGVKSGVCACEDGMVLGNDRTCVLPGNKTTTIATITTALRTTRGTTNDSIDASDEPLNSPTCLGGYFRCENGNCIPEQWACDGYDDCVDRSDEENGCHE